MAGLSGRELLLIVRAQNQASGTLRRVANDIRRLGTASSAGAQARALQERQMKQLATLQRAQNRLEDVTTGRSAQMAQREKNNLLNDQVMLNRKLNDTQSQMFSKQQDVTRAVEKHQQALRRAAQIQSSYARAGKTVPPMVSLASTAKVKQAEDSIRKQSNMFDRLRTQAAGYRTSLAAIPAALQASDARFANLGGRAKSAAADIRAAKAALAETEAEMAAFNKQVARQRWDKLGTGARTARDVGRSLGMIGLVAGAAFGAAAHSAAEFDKQARLVATQTVNIGQGFQAIDRNSKFVMKTVLDQMGKFPASSKDMNDALYEIYSSMNISLGGGAKLLSTFNKAAVAGQTSLTDVAKAGITVANAFARPGHEAQDMTGMMNRMFAAVHYGRMTFSEFVGTMSQTVPAMKASNQSFDTLAGTMAFITRYGIPNVRMAGTGLARLAEMFSRRDFVAGVKKFGVNITDSQNRLKPFPVIIDDLVKRFPKLQRGGQFLTNFFKTMTAAGGGGAGTMGTIQGRRVFQTLVQNAARYQGILHQVVGTQNDFNRAYASVSRSPGVRFDVFTNQLHKLWIELGQAVIPALTGFIGPIQRLVHWFDSLDESTRRSIGKWAVYATGAVALSAAFLMITGSIGGVIAMFGRLAGVRGIILAIVAALALLNGHVRGLHISMGGIANAMIGSFSRTLATVGMLAIAMKRMRTAQTGMRVAGAAGGGAGVAGIAETGVIAASMARFRGLKAGLSLVKEEALKVGEGGRGFKILSGAARGAGAAFTLLPGPLKLVAAALGVAGVASFFWQRHMAAARKRAEEVRAAYKSLVQTVEIPVKFALKAEGIGGSIANFTLARNEVARLKIEIQQQMKEIQGMRPGPQRALAIINLSDLRAQLVQAQGAVGQAFAQIQGKARAFNTAMQTALTFKTRQNTLRQWVADLEQQLPRLQAAQERVRQAMIARGGKGLGPDPALNRQFVDLQNQINNTVSRISGMKISIGGLGRGAAAALAPAKRAFMDYARTLQTMQLTPKISTANLNQAFQFIQKTGKLLTAKQLTMFVNVAMGKGGTSKFEAQVAAFLAGLRKKAVTIDVKAKVQAGKKVTANEILGLGKGPLKPSVVVDMLKIPKTKIPAMKIPSILQNPKFPKVKAPTVKVPSHVNMPGNVGGLGRNIANAIDVPPIKTHVAMPGGLEQIGRNISDGIASGMHSVDQKVTVTKVTNDIINEFHNVHKSHSPSVLFAEEVGVPIGQGIAVGMINSIPVMETAAGTMTTALVNSMVKSSSSAKSAISRISNSWVVAYLVGLGRLEKQTSLVTTILVEPVVKAVDDVNYYLEQNLFKGPFLSSAAFQKRIEGYTKTIKVPKGPDKEVKVKPIPLQGKDLIKDLKQLGQQYAMFNNSIGRLQQRHVPKAMLDELRALGADGAKYIHQLAEMTPRELNKAIKAWERYRAEIRRSRQETDKPLKLTIKDMTGDMKKQAAALREFNRDLALLAKRHVPPELLDELRGMGLDALPALRTMVGASKSLLAQYVAAWLQANAAVKASTVATAADTAAAVKQLVSDVAGAMLSMWQGIRSEIAGGFSLVSSTMQSRFTADTTSNLDQMKGFFGTITQGPLNLMERTSANYTAAKKQYDKDVRDYTNNLSDKQDDLAKAVRENGQALDDAAAADDGGAGSSTQRAEDQATKNVQIAEDSARQLQRTIRDMNRDYQRQQVADAKDFAEQLAQAQVDAIDSKTGEMKQAIGTLFQGPWLTGDLMREKIDWGIALSSDDLIKDLRMQVDAFESWRANIDKIRQRNVPAELADQLEALGLDAAKQLDALNNMTEDQLREYVTLWQRGQSAAKRAGSTAVADTTKLFDDHAKAVQKAADDLSLSIQYSIEDAATALSDQLADAAIEASRAIDDTAASADSGSTKLRELGDKADDTAKQIRDLTNDISDLNAEGPPTPPVPLDMGGMTGDLRAQVDNFERWQKALANLGARGIVPAKLMQELADLGPDATEMLEQLVQATDVQLTEYVNLWKRGQAAIAGAAQETKDSITKADVSEDLNNQVTEFSSWQSEIQKLVDRHVPMELIHQLQAMGPEALPYLKALNTMTDDELFGPNGYVDKWSKVQKIIHDNSVSQFQATINEWQQNGVNVVDALLSGMTAEESAIYEWFKGLADRVVADSIKNANAGPASSGGSSGSATPQTPGALPIAMVGGNPIFPAASRPFGPEYYNPAKPPPTNPGPSGMWAWINDQWTIIARTGGTAAGSAVAAGVAAGITASTPVVTSAATDMANAMNDKLRDGWGIASPSRYMRDEIGIPLGEGIAEGIQQSLPSVYDALSELRDMIATSATDVVEETTSSIGQSLDPVMSYSPPSPPSPATPTETASPNAGGSPSWYTHGQAPMDYGPKTTVHMTVNAQESPDLWAQLNRASFRLENLD